MLPCMAFSRFQCVKIKVIHIFFWSEMIAFWITNIEAIFITSHTPNIVNTVIHLFVLDEGSEHSCSSLITYQIVCVLHTMHILYNIHILDLT